MTAERKVAFLGFGSWGTALALLLANKGYDLACYSRNREETEKIRRTSYNDRYLPGIPLPPNIRLYSDMEPVLFQASIVISAVPSQAFRSTWEEGQSYIAKDALLVNTAKGLETDTLLRLSEISRTLLPDHPFAVLSGPSHAEEVARRMPTSVVAASLVPKEAKRVQDLFMTDRFRVYTAHDLVGVELGGALKNIMALGAGISDGIGFGDNAKAAMMTRGMAEIRRLGLAMGADPATFSGLAGMGDLIVTCTSFHSRNYRCGLLIGRGIRAKEAIQEIGMVVEGYYTAKAACELADRYQVDMPISRAVYACLCGQLTPYEAIDRLMTRSPKQEMPISRADLGPGRK